MRTELRLPVGRAPSEQGASILEYVLLLALVAAIGVGALAYLGRSDANFTQAGRAVSVGISGPGGAQVSSGSAGWCASGRAGCADTVVSGSGQVISFSASGGTAPYHYSLHGNPAFMSLSGLDPTTGKGEIVVSPPSCAQVQDYNAIVLVVTDSALPIGKGVLTFSLAVSKGARC